jgi:hypothetical protein
VYGVELGVNTLAFSVAAVVCGFEAIFFSVFARAVATDAKLLPRDPIIDRLRRFWTLERGIVSGAVLFTIGLAAALYAVGLWRQESFGDLDPAVTLRTVLPATAALMLGLQLLFASCLLSVINLRGPENKPQERGA